MSSEQSIAGAASARSGFAVPAGGVDAIIAAIAAIDPHGPAFVHERMDPIDRRLTSVTIGLRVDVRPVASRPFDELRGTLGQVLPGGGALAFIGYPSGSTPGHGEPPAALFMQMLDFITIDHATGRGEVVCVDGLTSDAELAVWASRCADARTTDNPAERAGIDDWSPDVSREAFGKAVARFTTEHANADVDGVVLSVLMSSPERSDPAASYRVLRAMNPSTCMFLVRTPAFSLWGATSLSLVEIVDRHLVAETDGATRSIPETSDGVPFVWNPTAKEIHEYDVVAQALWHDLLPVTADGTLHLTREREQRRFFGLGHLFAEAQADIAVGVDEVAVIETLYPHGATVGYPRREALALIDKLEPRDRGPFAGLVGLFDGDGGADVATVTRSMWTTAAGSFTRAGAKVVADSDPQSEYDESVLKTRALRVSARPGDVTSC